MAITVTMTFATYEDTIIALSKLRAGPQPEVKPETAKPDPKPDPKPEAPKANSDSKPEAPKRGLDRAAAPKTETKPEPESTGLVYETDVAPKIAAAVKTNRADVIAVLQRFDAKTGKDLKPADYAAFLEDLQTRIEASANLA